MNISIQQGLPYVSAILHYQGRDLSLATVLLDTGSAGTVFSVDKLLKIGVRLEPHDVVHRIYGVGGAEFVFMKQLDRLSVGDLVLENFEVEVGAMKYGIALDGILGMDFLLQISAVIDLASLEISR